MPAWPAITAFSIVSSESSLASDSTIRTASAVPATTRSRVESFISSIVGLTLIFALDDADARGADRAHEGNAGKGQRRRRGDHRQNVRVVLEVIGEDRRDDLRVAAELLGKQRADRPVDQARGQRFAVGQAPFALEIAARNAAGGEGLLLIVDGEGKEVLPGLRLLGGDDGRQHGRFAPGSEHRAVGLTGHAAGFEHELAPAPVEFFALYVKHLSSSCVVEDAKACGPCRPRFGLVIGKTARGWANASPLRSCHDARLPHGLRAPADAAARSLGRDARDRRPVRVGLAFSGGCPDAR